MCNILDILTYVSLTFCGCDQVFYMYGVLLPNVGREAHTYLHHIVTNYETIQQQKDECTFSLKGH